MFSLQNKMLILSALTLCLIALSAEAGWSCCKKIRISSSLKIDLSKPLKPKVEINPNVIRDTVFLPVNVGEKIFNQSGELLTEVKVAGERLAESRIYATGSISDCLNDIGKCVKDRPLEIASQGLILAVKDGEVLWDVAHKASEVTIGKDTVAVLEHTGWRLDWRTARKHLLPVFRMDTSYGGFVHAFFEVCQSQQPQLFLALVSRFVKVVKSVLLSIRITSGNG